MNILSTLPVQGATNVALLPEITITFDADIDTSLVDDSVVTVYTDKKTLVSVKESLPQPNFAFDVDDFFNTEYTAIIKGKVTAAGSVLTFTPAAKLSATTKYTVNISKSIADLAGNFLPKIYSFSFTTREEDMVEPLPQHEEYTKILNTNLEIVDSFTSPESGYLSVIRTLPKQDTFLISNKTIKVTFGHELAAVTKDKVTVYKHLILSDEPAEEITDFTVSNTGAELSIVLGDTVVVSDCSYEIILSKDIAGVNTYKLKDDYAFAYTTRLTPYYVSTKLIRLLAGTVLSEVPDINIALAINYFSKEADTMFRKITADGISTIKSKYVLYSTLYSVLTNNNSVRLHDFIKKDFVEFSLSVSSKNKINLYNQLVKDADKNLTRIKSFLTAKSSNSHIIRNQNRSSEIGRLWDRNAPGINSKVYGFDRSLNVWDDILQEI